MKNTERPIGEGTFGKVYLAEVNGRVSAVKELLVTKERGNFCANLREIDIAKRLVHPNIISLLEVGTSTRKGVDWSEVCSIPASCDCYNMNFEYMSEGDLYEHMNRKYRAGIPITLVELKSIFIQCLLGLVYMHSYSYIHRDIKPTNILINKAGVVKICDFGITRKFLPYAKISALAGSQFYRAPEILLRLPYNLTSDIWSMGCVFVFMATGSTLDRLVNVDGLEDARNDPNDFISELRFITLALPYTIHASFFEGPVDAEVLGHVVRDDNVVTVGNYFTRHRFKMEQDDVLAYQQLVFQDMLHVAPSLRQPASKLITNPFFATPECKRYINLANRRTILNEDQVTSSAPTPAYDAMVVVAKDIFTKHREAPWYTDQTLFRSIDIYSRLLMLARPSLTHTSDEHTARDYFITCLYVAIKYHASSDYEIVPPYNSLPYTSATPEALRQAKAREDNVLGAFQFKIYNKSILDIHLEHAEPTMLDLLSLFLFITTLNATEAGDDLTPTASYRKWTDNRTDYARKARGHSYWKLVEKSEWRARPRDAD